MRGKKPSEREKYVLPAGRGAYVEVTREVYLEWHQSRRRERYQVEKKQAHGVCSLEALGENALSVLSGSYWENTPEENAAKLICMEKVQQSISRLPEQDACRDRILAQLREEMAVQGIVRGYF